MTKLKVTLRGSQIGATPNQRENLKGLGLRRIGQSRVLENTPAVRGMVKKDLGEMFALLDWESEFTAKYGFLEGHANFLLFDAEGVLKRKEHLQELDEAVLAELVEDIAGVMGESVNDDV